MKFVGTLAVLAALVAPLANGAAIDNGLTVQNDNAKTMAGWSYSLCGDEQDLVDVKSIQLSPDPPKPGSDLTVTASGFVKDTIEEGAYADVTVKMGLIKLLQKQFDICEEARNNNATLQCPVASDEYAIQQTVALPNEIPRAKFKIEVRAYTEDERSLLCLNLNIDFMQRPFFKAIGW